MKNLLSFVWNNLYWIIMAALALKFIAWIGIGTIIFVAVVGYVLTAVLEETETETEKQVASEE